MTKPHFYKTRFNAVVLVAAVTFSAQQGLKAAQPDYQISIMAAGGSEPALELLNGQWQIAFTAGDLYLQTFGGAPKAIVRRGDTVPFEPFCYFYAVDGRVSMSQGAVAFSARTIDYNIGIRPGIYVWNGIGRPVRTVADATTPIPGHPGSTFYLFGYPSLNNGHVVFGGYDGGNWGGIYGDFGHGLTVVADPNSHGGDVETFTGVDWSYVSLSSQPFCPPPNSSCEAVAFDAGGTSIGNVSNVRFQLVDPIFDGAGGSFIDYADSIHDFQYNNTVFFSPSLDVSGQIAFYGGLDRSGQSGIYTASPVVRVGSAMGGLPYTLNSPSTFASPKQGLFEHWVGFADQANVYIQHDGPGIISSVAKIIDSQTALHLLAPILPWAQNCTPDTANIDLSPAGVYNGAVAFGLFCVVQRNAFEEILLARPMTNNVSSQVRVTSTGFLYSRVTKTFNGTVTITNAGSQTLTGLLEMALNNLPAGVTLANATGYLNGALGAPVILVPGVTTLSPGQTATVPLQFSNPSNGPLGFTPAIYSGN